MNYFIVLLISIGIFCLPVFNLQCEQCFANPCLNQVEITCDENAAGDTVAQLVPYYQIDDGTLKLPFHFECLSLNASIEHVTNTSNKSVLIKGCIFKQLNSCNLSLRPVYKSKSQQDCFECSGNLCNHDSNINGSKSNLSNSSLIFVVINVILIALSQTR
ncbi:hypothetical protein ACFFRR_005188 [Megaselia abdita]